VIEEMTLNSCVVVFTDSENLWFGLDSQLRDFQLELSRTWRSGK